MTSFFQNFHNIGGLLLANGLELFAVGNPQVRAHIIGTISQVDLQVLVTKYFLIVAKDGIRELWVECRNGLEARFRRRHEADVERLVGILKPCSANIRKRGFAESKMDPYTLRGWEDQPWSKEKRRGARFQGYSEVAGLCKRNNDCRERRSPTVQSKRKRGKERNEAVFVATRLVSCNSHLWH